MSGTYVSRRLLLGFAAAAPVAACAGGPEAPVSGPAPGPETSAPEPSSPQPAPAALIYPAIIDTASNVAPYLAQLKTLGVRIIFRYYALGPQPEVPEKQLTAGEADAILDQGFAIGSVFQHYSNVAENIHAERGKQDGDTSLQRAASFGQPQGSAIYFGVDFDWLASDAAKRANILAYFTEVSSRVKAAGYRVGVYGSGQTCTLVLDAGLADLAWLVNSPGHGGAAAFYNTGRWRMFQNGLDTRIPGGRLQVDTNLVNPAHTDVGQWTRSGAGDGVPGELSAGVRAQRRFVALKSAKLRAGPDDGAAEIANTRFGKGRTVRLVSESGGWAQVDVNEAGAATGWCRADALVSLDRRPDYFAAD
jgi:hypothetical protein